jgi:hypothetical protein
MAARAAALAPMHNWISVASAYLTLGRSFAQKLGNEVIA